MLALKQIRDNGSVTDVDAVELRVGGHQRGRHHEAGGGHGRGERLALIDQLQDRACEALLEVLKEEPAKQPARILPVM